MNKRQMVERVAKVSGIAKNRAEKAVECVISEITASLARGEPVRFAGFGTFDIALRQSRCGRNVVSGEPILIPSKIVPVFRPGSFLKDAVEERNNG